MRKHLGWYLKGFPGAAALRLRAVTVNTLADVEGMLDELAARLGTEPAPLRRPAELEPAV